MCVCLAALVCGWVCHSVCMCMCACVCVCAHGPFLYLYRYVRVTHVRVCIFARSYVPCSSVCECLRAYARSCTSMYVCVCADAGEYERVRVSVCACTLNVGTITLRIHQAHIPSLSAPASAEAIVAASDTSLASIMILSETMRIYANFG